MRLYELAREIMREGFVRKETFLNRKKLLLDILMRHDVEKSVKILD